MEWSGRLLGRGRHADVFEAGPGRVLRRYRSGQDAGPEAAVMDHVRRYGYPAPEVFRVDGADMEMERVEGPGLLELIAWRPQRIGYFAGMLAELHHRLHDIPAPQGLSTPVGSGDRVLHLDLQPGNVAMTRRGPVVLDWDWAAAGPPVADSAHTWLQLATSEIPGPAAVRLVSRFGRDLFVRRFLDHFDRDGLRQVLAEVAEYRLTVRELTVKERNEIPLFVRRVGGNA